MCIFYHKAKKPTLKPMGKGEILFRVQGHTTRRLEVIPITYSI